MINEITCTSNNAIELSRGQLISWVNLITKANLTKIQQLGNGIVYCQLLDTIYPGKVPLSKVNTKAKLQYQYVNNFKILQQSFTKLNIMKHIEIQRLVKCKYQDNLQFLQWFKKIFDTANRPCDQSRDQRRFSRQRSGPNILNSSISSETIDQYQLNLNQNIPQHTLRVSTERTSMSSGHTRNHSHGLPRPPSYLQNTIKQNILRQNTLNTPKMEAIYKNAYQDQKTFYIRKFSQIEHLMEEWDHKKSSEELIGDIRSIILAAPETKWEVVNGQFVQQKQSLQIEMPAE